MPKCFLCGKKEPAMRCVCGDCINPDTNLGHALSHGMEGLVQLILDVYAAGSFCREWNDCIRKAEAGEEIGEGLCQKCIVEWLLAPRKVDKS